MGVVCLRWEGKKGKERRGGDAGMVSHCLLAHEKEGRKGKVLHCLLKEREGGSLPPCVKEGGRGGSLPHQSKETFPNVNTAAAKLLMYSVTTSISVLVFSIHFFHSDYEKNIHFEYKRNRCFIGIFVPDNYNEIKSVGWTRHICS